MAVIDRFGRQPIRSFELALVPLFEAAEEAPSGPPPATRHPVMMACEKAFQAQIPVTRSSVDGYLALSHHDPLPTEAEASFGIALGRSASDRRRHPLTLRIACQAYEALFDAVDLGGSKTMFGGGDAVFEAALNGCADGSPDGSGVLHGYLGGGALPDGAAAVASFEARRRESCAGAPSLFLGVVKGAGGVAFRCAGPPALAGSEVVEVSAHHVDTVPEVVS